MKRITMALFLSTLALSACSEASSAAADNCEAKVGAEPWLVLFTEDFGPDCIAVGVHQDLQIWNKGPQPLIIEWQGGAIDIPPDDHYETGPLGEIVEPGVHPIVASPYSAPDLQVIDPSDSFSARTDLTLDGFGPITLGMTTEEAADASGLAIVNDPDYPPGRGCWLAIIAHDPYSPSFTMEERGGESTIAYVTTSYPLNGTRTIGLSTALVSPRCSGN
jgi:hypothetical protein